MRDLDSENSESVNTPAHTPSTAPFTDRVLSDHTGRDHRVSVSESVDANWDVGTAGRTRDVAPIEGDRWFPSPVPAGHEDTRPSSTYTSATSEVGLITDPACCPNCLAERQPTWAFCQACGTSLCLLDNAETLVSLDRTHVVPKSESRDAVSGSETNSPPGYRPVAASQQPKPAVTTTASQRRTRRILSISAICLAFIATVAAGSAGWVRFNDSQDLLRDTERQLGNTSSELTFTEDILERTRDELDSTTSTLVGTREKLDALTGRLKETRGSLNNAQSRLDLQASQIDTLQACLGGVTEALSFAAYQLLDDAVAALQAVQNECQRAQKVI